MLHVAIGYNYEFIYIQSSYYIYNSCINSATRFSFMYVGDMLIFITLHGKTEKTIKLELDLSDTVKYIKEIVQTLEGIPSKNQALILSKKELQDDYTISDYDIQSGSTINLVRIVAIQKTKWLLMQQF